MKVGDILKEGKHLYFAVKKLKPKTVVVHVINKSQSDGIATIEWYSPWRQYVFAPESYTVWSRSCLDDVNEVLGKLNKKDIYTVPDDNKRP